MSSLFKASLILTVFFGINKIVALLRQAIIARQFGFSAEIDAFNVANNVPDLLFSLISGGALALAFIPVLSEYLDKKGQQSSWKLFSTVANLVFLSTAVLSIIVAIFAETLVKSQFGIAPGFNTAQQDLTIQIMRLNLIATTIFSLSGLVMAALQANKHFLLPAIAPILYNLGQIFGAVFLVPIFGVYGLVYGVIIGALLHLGIQIPAMIHYKFHWTPSLNFKDPGVLQTMSLMGPRILTVLLIQIMFLTRDNLASRLQEGSVTALTYGYFIMQVPETLIGTAIATALLPTLSQFAAEGKKEQFGKLLNSTIKVILAITLITTGILFLSLNYFLTPLFGVDTQGTNLLVWTARAYLLGLLSQCLLEVVTRAFYAKQNAKTPLIATILRTILFVSLALVLLKSAGVIGLALADTIAISLEVAILLVILRKSLPHLLTVHRTLIRAIIGTIVSSTVIYALATYLPLSKLPWIFIPFLAGSLVALPFVKNEIKLLFKL